MESDVAYVRHVDEDSSYPDSSVFDQRYSAHQADPDGYETYSLETSVVAAAQHRNDADMNYQRKTYTVDPLMTAIHIFAVYWIGLIGPLIVLAIGYKTLYIQHHAFQGLVVTTLIWVISLCFFWNWIALVVVFSIAVICFIALTVRALLDIKTEAIFKLPGIGEWAYGMASRRVAAERVR